MEWNSLIELIYRPFIPDRQQPLQIEGGEGGIGGNGST
jgi:hypothetical protein